MVHELYILFRRQFYCACVMIKQNFDHTTKKSDQPDGPGSMFNDGPQGQQPPPGGPGPEPLETFCFFNVVEIKHGVAAGGGAWCGSRGRGLVWQ